jgi:hypothetical protein
MKKIAIENPPNLGEEEAFVWGIFSSFATNYD